MCRPPEQPPPLPTATHSRPPTAATRRPTTVAFTLTTTSPSGARRRWPRARGRPLQTPWPAFAPRALSTARKWSLTSACLPLALRQPPAVGPPFDPYPFPRLAAPPSGSDSSSKTQQYVLWWNYVQDGTYMGYAVATAPHPAGPFALKNERVRSLDPGCRAALAAPVSSPPSRCTTHR